MTADPAFVREEKAAGLEVHLTPGAAQQAIVEELVGAPPDVVAKVKIAISGK